MSIERSIKELCDVIKHAPCRFIDALVNAHGGGALLN